MSVAHQNINSSAKYYLAEELGIYKIQEQVTVYKSINPYVEAWRVLLWYRLGVETRLGRKPAPEKVRERKGLRRQRPEQNAVCYSK